MKSSLDTAGLWSLIFALFFLFPWLRTPLMVLLKPPMSPVQAPVSLVTILFFLFQPENIHSNQNQWYTPHTHTHTLTHRHTYAHTRETHIQGKCMKDLQKYTALYHTSAINLQATWDQGHFSGINGKRFFDMTQHISSYSQEKAFTSSGKQNISDKDEEKIELLEFPT